MKFSLVASTLAFAGTALAESHNVKLVNKCGSGKPVFLYQGHSNPRGSGTIDGRVLGGVAWVDGFAGADCKSSGVNCGIVEFTLTNPGNSDGNTQNAADYSLLTGNGLGNHKYTYKMDFEFTGSCTKKAPGPCTGNSAEKCPGAYLGSQTEGGKPVQCTSNDTGITITFC
ncbi:hypothetical protein VNI00_018398 [Paramarasmius palmivorus]|uniref:Uncharacterized protein n=1 Tax=Paramarasmius palmivorus TaxID=297713 RepID=A0AAW0AXX4_9AGAR